MVLWTEGWPWGRGCQCWCSRRQVAAVQPGHGPDAAAHYRSLLAPRLRTGAGDQSGECEPRLGCPGFWGRKMKTFTVEPYSKYGKSTKSLCWRSLFGVMKVKQHYITDNNKNYIFYLDSLCTIHARMHCQKKNIFRQDRTEQNRTVLPASHSHMSKSSHPTARHSCTDSTCICSYKRNARLFPQPYLNTWVRIIKDRKSQTRFENDDFQIKLSFQWKVMVWELVE